MMLADASPWLAVFGRAHFVLLHAPLGLVPAIALLEFGAVALGRPVPRGAITAIAWLAAACGASAAASGLVLAGSGGYEHELLGQHKVLGIALGAVCVVVAVAALFANRAPLRVALLAALGLMVPAGHYGGTMTHGDDFLFAPLRPKAPPTPPADSGAPTPPTAPATAFERTIRPLLERTCTGCHNEDKKKGELVLTTRAGIEAGGENGPVLVPGKPDASPLLVLCEKPLDDDAHMPPAEKPQPTRAELDTLRWWIAAGAPFE